MGDYFRPELLELTGPYDVLGLTLSQRHWARLEKAAAAFHDLGHELDIEDLLELLIDARLPELYRWVRDGGKPGDWQ
jgi:hypothetical protein